MTLPYARDITCSSCGPAEETDTGECRQCKAEIARERCSYITVKAPMPGM